MKTKPSSTPPQAAQAQESGAPKNKAARAKAKVPRRGAIRKPLSRLVFDCRSRAAASGGAQRAQEEKELQV